MDAFYLKYRPRLISELEHIPAREMLKKIIAQGEIPHSFLFVGPKGIGKTSAARILAKILGCLDQKGVDPCSKCEVCQATDQGTNLDIIEIDAASNRGIDDIRELRDKINLRPIKARNKIYIVDEVHMLTQEAFNGILKTLEEPPEHAYFIFCTTNREKIPETVLSRLTIINFSRATDGEIITSLKRVVKGEAIKIDDESLKLIAQSADGSFRDGQKILYQLYLAEGKKISKKATRQLVGRWLMFLPRELVKLILMNKQKKALKISQDLEKEAIDFGDYLKRCLEWVQKLIFFKLGIEDEQLIEEEYLNHIKLDQLVHLANRFSQALQEQKTTPIAALPLQLLIASWSPKQPERETIKKAEKKTTIGAKNQILEKQKEEKSLAKENKISFKLIQERWSELLKTIKPMNHSVEALLRACRPLSLNGNRLTIEVFYQFHKEKLEEERHRQIVEEGIKKIFGIRQEVFCVLAKKRQEHFSVSTNDNQEKKDKSPEDELFEAAKEIFGS